MKKVLSMLMMAMIGSVACLAASSLCVHLTDGTEIVCKLNKEPQMTFGEKTVSLTSLDGAVGEWNFTDVDSWSFSEADAIDEAKENKQISIADDQLTVAGVAANSIAVYDLSGKVVATSKQSIGNATTVSLAGLTKGVYILKVGNSSIKFMVK